MTSENLNSELLLNALSNLLDGVILLDAEGRIIFWNMWMSRASGYELGEVVGKTVEQLFPEQAGGRLANAVIWALKNGLPSVLSPSLNRHPLPLSFDGRCIEQSIYVQPLSPKGQVSCCLICVSDVTALMEKERLLRAKSERLGAELDTFYELIPEMLCIASGEGRFLKINPTWTDVLGYSEQEILATPIIEFVHPDDRAATLEEIRHQMSGKDTSNFCNRYRCKDGSYRWLEWNATPDVSMGLMFCAARDITERKKTEELLRVAAVSFETHEAILITDANANIIRVNQAFQDITGYSEEEVLGKNPHILSAGRHDKVFYEAMWSQLLETGTWSGEMWDRSKSGRIYPKWLTITAVKNSEGVTTEYVAMFSDISDRKKSEEEIYNLAFYDTLTQLPNRRHLLDRMRQAQLVSARSKLYGALLFLDMDRFKILNDTLGHDQGDLFLIEVAHRLLLGVRDMDIVARIGGDEFVLLIEEIGESPEEVSQKVAVLAEKIRALLSSPYWVGTHEHHSSPSIGVCLFCDSEEPVDSLLKHADMAMYQAKESGGNAVRFYDPAMQQAVESRAALETELHRAIQGGQFRLYYQMQVSSEDQIIGAEALIRWEHPIRGLISPLQFIPIAEESALILDIGHWVLEAACQQLAQWHKSELTRHLSLSINVSAVQFVKHDFVNIVRNTISFHQFEPGRLKLELTEAVVLSDVDDVVNKMHALKAFGVGLSLDDFGTGYSSLSYLKRLPLDQLKIDQSFIRHVATDMSDAVMVKAIIDLAQNFRLNVIAEGVETPEQLEFLKQNGCAQYQGCLFGKPVPIEDYETLLKGYL